ncbi:hypothetical protein ACFQZC_26720 [Streptacidiphilus monticola]
MTRIRLHHEFHALAAAAPVLGETAAALPPQDRRGITESLGRAYAAAFLDEPADREPDTGLLALGPSAPHPR